MNMLSLKPQKTLARRNMNCDGHMQGIMTATEEFCPYVLPLHFWDCQSLDKIFSWYLWEPTTEQAPPSTEAQGPAAHLGSGLGEIQVLLSTALLLAPTGKSHLICNADILFIGGGEKKGTWILNSALIKVPPSKSYHQVQDRLLRKNKNTEAQSKQQPLEWKKHWNPNVCPK